jgi:hypothetical protein
MSGIYGVLDEAAAFVKKLEKDEHGVISGATLFKDISNF